MREFFPGYYRPSDDEFKVMWKESKFIFDANVLLDMYSYPESARDIFFSVLSKVEGRTWIPYQVALEFHRNRTNRIKQSNKKIEQLLEQVKRTGDELQKELRSIEFEKRNTGIEDIEERLNAVQISHQSLSEAIQLACNRLPVVGLDEAIGLKIADMFDGKVGAPPGSQAELSEMLKDAEDRYEKKIPPGFEDVKKGSEYRDRGVIYQAKYGDLVLWNQLIKYVNDENIENIIFITGDRKSDWWLIEDGRALGPLPELVQEILQRSKLKKFWMYSADQFLQNAEQYLGASEVTQETIAQVKETLTSLNDWEFTSGDWIDLNNKEIIEHGNDYARIWAGEFHGKNYLPEALREKLGMRTGDVISAIEMWLVDTIEEGAIMPNRTFPEYIVTNGDTRSGYGITILNSLENSSIANLPRTFKNARAAIFEGEVDDMTIIIGIHCDNFNPDDSSLLGNFRFYIRSLKEKMKIDGVVFGYCRGAMFVPVFKMN
ncbi:MULTISPECIES: PIN-like domain-containing protein [Janthinobacterium]|uniref:PIN-like domain-containing protein n=1 Tax=Janthinobacterium TaxID=29580 RepID=UPI001C5B7AA3|nr:MULTISPECIES: PIN-like domain-containing protein [Janthinobacterium]MBW3508494.1 hypothetical protein [Janthinobacterium sp. NKUCC06_STL]MCA1861413.1 hypothetical protein [Janthinobacterium lividum]